MIIEKKLTSRFTPANTEKKLIVIHWVAGTGPGCVRYMLGKKCPVSAHYVVDRLGKVIQLVKEKDISWHAGYSTMAKNPQDKLKKEYFTKVNGQDWYSLNPCSIGIENAGPPSYINRMIQDKGWNLESWDGWPKPLIDALIEICIDIKSRWPNIKITDHWAISTRYDKSKKDFYLDKNGNYVKGWRKGDVRKGKGIDFFPWERLLKETGIEEA